MFKACVQPRVGLIICLFDDNGADTKQVLIKHMLEGVLKPGMQIYTYLDSTQLYAVGKSALYWK